MKGTLFSVIIPTLNEEKYIPRLLSDLSVQNFTSFEVIVVDGSSDDKTLDRVSEKIGLFKEKGIKLSILTTKRISAPYQRNAGAKKAKGEYIVFFDADVRISPLYLRRAVSG